MKEWAIIKPLISLLFSRKFLVLFIATTIASGASWAADLEIWIPVIVAFGAAVFSTLTAWEDAAFKRAGNGPT